MRGRHRVEDLTVEDQGEVSLGNVDGMKKFVETGNTHGDNNA